MEAKQTERIDKISNLNSVDKATSAVETDTCQSATTKLKLSELKGDAFFDFICAAKPLIELLVTSKLLKTKFFPDSEKSVIEASKAVKEGGNLNTAVENTIYRAVKNDILLVFDIATKEKRTTIYEALAILDETDVETVKTYDGITIYLKLRSLADDEGFKRLFTSAA